MEHGLAPQGLLMPQGLAAHGFFMPQGLAAGFFDIATCTAPDVPARSYEVAATERPVKAKTATIASRNTNISLFFISLSLFGF